MYIMDMASDRTTTGRLLWQVTTRWRTAVDRALAPIGLTHAQYSLLASLYGLALRGDRPSQRELADAAGLEPIYVSKLTRGLEKAGLLVREEHPDDPRALALTLTERGTDVVQQAITIVRGLQDELTAPIGGTGGRRNRELVATLQTLLGRAPGDPPNGPDTMTQAPPLTGQDIAEAQGAVSGLLAKILDGSGVTASEYIALRVLAVRGPWESPAALHEFMVGQRQLGLDAPAVADLLAGLERRGLAAGTAHDDSGPVRITAEGRELYGRLLGAVQSTTQRLYDDLDPADLATARRVLTQVTERANDLRTEV